MSALKDIRGLRFGRLIVSSRGPNTKSGRATWRCFCDCRNVVIVEGKRLRNGHTKSCGCLKSDKSSARMKTHGMSDTPEYKTWCLMKERCYRPGHKDWKYYGGKGVLVCYDWRRFENFYADMGPRPFPDATIDRIDPNGNYEPSNCRWLSMRDNVLHSKGLYEGEYRTSKGMFYNRI